MPSPPSKNNLKISKNNIISHRVAISKKKKKNGNMIRNSMANL
jgi:hypothetical protein